MPVIYLSTNYRQRDRYKGRIHARSNSGIAVGIIKSRDRALESGDLFRTNSDKLLLIYLPEPELLIHEHQQSCLTPKALT